MIFSKKTVLRIVELILCIAGISLLIYMIIKVADLFLNQKDYIFSGAPLILLVLTNVVLYGIPLLIIIVANFLVRRKMKAFGVASTTEIIFNKVQKYKLIVFLSIVPLLLLFACLFIWFFQNLFMFFPCDNYGHRHYLSQRAEYEVISVEGDMGNTYEGWIHRDSSESKYLIYFGGNAQCSATTFYQFEENGIWDYFSGYNVVMVDYSEYGLSEGEIGEKSMFDMAQATYNYLISEEVSPENIYVMGYSIGSGVAVYLSSIEDVGGLILFAPYDEAISLYNRALNIFHGPLEGLVRNKLQSKLYASDVRVQALIVASVDDKTIPFSLSENLAGYFKTPPRFESVDDVDHNGLFDDPVSMEYLREYLN